MTMGIRVTMPNGQVIQRPIAADTLADVIETLGLETVRKLNLTIAGVPLVGTSRHMVYMQKERGRYFVMTHCDTMQKKKKLEQLADRLGIRLRVDVVRE